MSQTGPRQLHGMWERQNGLLLFYVLAVAALRIFRRGILLALTLLGLWCRSRCRHRRRHRRRDRRHNRLLRHSRCLRRHIRHCCRTRLRGRWQAIESLVVPVPNSLGDLLPDQTEDQSTLLVRADDVQTRDPLFCANDIPTPGKSSPQRPRARLCAASSCKPPGSCRITGPDHGLKLGTTTKPAAPLEVHQRDCVGVLHVLSRRHLQGPNLLLPEPSHYAQPCTWPPPSVVTPFAHTNGMT